MKIVNILCLLLIVGIYIPVNAQQNDEQISLTLGNWECNPKSIEFLTTEGNQSMTLKSSVDKAILKDFSFSDGTIEYDIKPIDERFSFIYFRWSNADDTESLYLRNQRAGNSLAVDAIQYSPFIKGVNLWDMYNDYQSNAEFKTSEWNHVKLIISGKQMLVFINDMQTPSLEIPHLEANSNRGTIAFSGKSIIKNLVVKHNEVEGLSPNPSVDVTNNDPRYVKKWEVSQPIELASMSDFKPAYFPDSLTQWNSISAERNGLVNLTRKFGASKKPRLIWLKANINSIRQQKVKLNLGFSDDVWVFMNKQPVYMDKNIYGTPMMKRPKGRCSIENTSFFIPLSTGENEILIGVSNVFFGWGIMARFDEILDFSY